MNIESKFLFICKFFIILFIIINLTYLIPFNVFEISYYINSSTAIVDTSTLLILGLAIPKFIYLKNIQKYIDSNNSLDSFSDKIEKLKMKNFYNSKVSFFISIFFAMLMIIQPLNIIFLLNRNDIYSSSMIQLFNNQLKTDTQKIENEFNLINKELPNNEKSFDIEQKKDILKNVTQKNIDNFLEINNKNIFNKIKFIIRNLIMAFIWAIVFYKLSLI